jgi:hypothetical protein
MNKKEKQKRKRNGKGKGKNNKKKQKRKKKSTPYPAVSPSATTRESVAEATYNIQQSCGATPSHDLGLGSQRQEATARGVLGRVFAA